MDKLDSPTDKLGWKTKWIVTKYADHEAYKLDRPFDVAVVDGNLALNEGIAEVAALIIGDSATAFDNANAYIGVGADNTAAAASQTGLQAPSNKLYKAMEATYPQISGQTITWRSVFGSSEANFQWLEFTVANGNSDSAVNLNRKVTDQGTKASGMVWTLDLQITLG